MDGSADDPVKSAFGLSTVPLAPKNARGARGRMSFSTIEEGQNGLMVTPSTVERLGHSPHH